jgi:hypothetical protein
MEPVTMVIVGVAVGGAVVAARRFRHRAINGTVALLGPRQAGKTSFATALETGEIPPGYKPTQTPQNRTFNVLRDSNPHGFAVKMPRYGLHITSCDVAGNEDALGQWKTAASGANLVCYLVSAPDLKEAPYCKRALDGARQVGSWRLPSHVMLVLTHVDEDPDREDPDAIQRRPVVAELRRALGGPELWLTSLIRPNDRHELMLRTLEILSQPRTVHA